ncbi:hypothetical protein ACIQCR_16030 [Streptomyces sp. NPDC093249]|uniref:hypothetical protein n=1 Tax=unclassified Streptomyces TaxID=2593676 RepID=UPI0038026C2C
MPSASPVARAGAAAQMPKVSTDSMLIAWVTARSGTRRVSRARIPPGTAAGPAPASSAKAARTTGWAPGQNPMPRNPAAPAASPAASCGRARSAFIRIPRTGAAMISPRTYAAASTAPSAYPPGRSRTRNTSASGAMATGSRPVTVTADQRRTGRVASER